MSHQIGSAALLLSMTVQLPAARLAPAALMISLIAACGPLTSLGGDSLVRPKEVSAQSLQRSQMDERVRAFYAARDWRPAWSPSSARQLQDAFKVLDRHAIASKPFVDRLATKDPISREVALTKAAMAYGDALAHGLIDPGKVFEVYGLERNDLNVDRTLAAALSAGDLEPWLKSLAPADPEYERLSEAYLGYLKDAASRQPAPIPSGEAIKPGGQDPRVPRIVQALVAGRYLKEAPATADRYEPAVVEAIKRFQTQQGVNNDGVIGADTIAILNAGPADRARQLALNLEVRRWLKRTPPPTRIDVNTAAAVMTTYENGKIIDVRRVVVGKPDAPTPNLAGLFSDLVLNPPWNVPQGIAEREILPKGTAYMREHDMYVDEGRVVQRPGPKASLGRVKFDMQNPHAIYLHDTPSKTAFAANERHGSHGCVRVDDALGYARGLAAAAGLQSAFDAKLAEGSTSALGLKTAMPVRLMYQTAFVDRSGELAFRPDIYGWDERLARALRMPAPMKRETRASDTDVGP